MGRETIILYQSVFKERGSPAWRDVPASKIGNEIDKLCLSKWPINCADRSDAVFWWRVNLCLIDSLMEWNGQDEDGTADIDCRWLTVITKKWMPVKFFHLLSNSHFYNSTKIEKKISILTRFRSDFLIFLLHWAKNWRVQKR